MRLLCSRESCFHFLQQDCRLCFPLLYEWLWGSVSVREMKSFLEGEYIL